MMRGINMFRGVMMAVAVFLALAGPAYAQDEVERPKIPIEMYGQLFSTEPIRIPEATLSYDQVKAYVPLVLVSMHDPKSERSVFEIVNYLDHVLRAYESTYNVAITILGKRLHHFFPDRDVIELEFEVADYIRAGQWKALIEKYGHVSKSVPPQILDAQKIHHKYLALLYVVEMVAYSTEAVAAFAIPEEEQHTHDEPVPVSEKYATGYGYDRLHFHDYTVQDGKPKFPWEEPNYIEPE